MGTALIYSAGGSLLLPCSALSRPAQFILALLCMIRRVVQSLLVPPAHGLAASMECAWKPQGPRASGPGTTYYALLICTACVDYCASTDFGTLPRQAQSL